MKLSHRAGDAQEKLEGAALRSISVNYYGRVDDPNYAAEQEHVGEQLALAARDLVRLIDELPPDKRPVGWDDPDS